MKNYSKPTLTTIDKYMFETVCASSGDPIDEPSTPTYSCCSCHGSHPMTYEAFYEFHCLNCSNLLANGTCLYGKNSGRP